MSYICYVCRRPTPPKTIMQRHVVYKNLLGRRQIARELPVCGACKALVVEKGLQRAVQYRQSEAKADAVRAGAAANGEAASSSPAASVANVVAATPLAPLFRPAKRVVLSAPALKQRLAGPKCDVCGAPVGEGQVTAEACLCERHCHKARGDV